MHFTDGDTLQIELEFGNFFFRRGENWSTQRKNLSVQGREPAISSTHIRRQNWKPNWGHIDWRQVLSPSAAPSLHPHTNLFLLRVEVSGHILCFLDHFWLFWPQICPIFCQETFFLLFCGSFEVKTHDYIQDFLITNHKSLSHSKAKSTQKIQRI